jgi:hypothetical protein
MPVRIIALILSLMSFAAWASPDRVIIIRHAEKPEDKKDDTGSLSPVGVERAKKLVDYFEKTLANKYGVPVAIYTFKSKQDGKKFRGVETVTPLATSLKVEVDSSFKEGEEKDLVKFISKAGHYEGKTVLICWEHHLMHEILKQFGMKHAPDVPDAAFDRTWVVDLDKNGDFADFHDLPQHLMPGDSAK